jgi:hypothetical protein
MTVLRLTRWHAIAWVAAIALIGTTALDWYSTTQGEANRRDQRLTKPSPGPGGEGARMQERDLEIAAEQREANPWQLSSGIDIFLLIVLLAAVAATIAASLIRSAGREAKPPLTPSLFALALSVLAAVLLAFRLVQQPGLDSVATIQAGLPLALVALGAMIIANARAWQAEQVPMEPVEERAAPDAAPAFYDQAEQAPPPALYDQVPPAPPPRADQAQPGPPPRRGPPRGDQPSTA